MLTMTENAVQKVNEYMTDEENKGKALRVFVEGVSGAVMRDVVDNVAEAAAVARRVLVGDASG